MRQHYLIFFLILFLSTSCGTSSYSPSKPIQRLRLAIAEEPTTLDPRKGGDSLSSHLHFMLFEGLVKINQDGSTSPAQCFQIDLSEDKKTYTFHLGKTKWSDGMPVTSYDFEKAWKAILSPSFPSPNAHLLYPIILAEKAKKGLVSTKEIGIRAPNAETLIVTLEHPTPYFLPLISFCVFFPIPLHIENKSPDWAFHDGDLFVSNGPFMLDRWKHNNELLLKKNPHYLQASSVNLDEIHLSIIGSEITAFQLYESGEIDLIGPPFSSIPLDVQEKFFLNKQVVISPSAATTFITFNTTTFPFSNTNLRRAFSLAINRQLIAQHVTQFGEDAAFCAVPPSLKNNQYTAFYSDGNIKEAQEFFAKALEELNVSKKELEAGLIYHYSHSEGEHKVAQVLQQQWLENLQVHVQLKMTDRKTLMESISRKKHIFAQALYRAQYPDPVNILDRFRYKENVKNYSSWENQEYQDLLAQSFLETGQERLSTLIKSEAILLKEAPIAPLFHLNLCYLTKPTIGDIEFSPVGGMFLERLSIKPTIRKEAL